MRFMAGAELFTACCAMREEEQPGVHSMIESSRIADAFLRDSPRPPRLLRWELIKARALSRYFYRYSPFPVQPARHRDECGGNVAWPRVAIETGYQVQRVDTMREASRLQSNP